MLIIMSIIGVILNNNRREECFYIWIGTNFSWFVYDLYKGVYMQAILFAIYLLLAIHGVLKWKNINIIKGIKNV